MSKDYPRVQGTIRQRRCLRFVMGSILRLPQPNADALLTNLVAHGDTKSAGANMVAGTDIPGAMVAGGPHDRHVDPRGRNTTGPYASART